MARQTAGIRTIRTVGILVGVLLLLPVLLMVVMMSMMGMMGGGISQMDAVGMSPLWGMGTMLISLLVVTGLVYAAYRLLSRETGFTEDPALAELRLAFARGDISEEEYENRRERLKQDR